MIALTLSDGFVVERHRAGLLGFIEGQVDLLFANEAEICALFQTDDFDAAVERAARRTSSSPPSPAAQQGSVVAQPGRAPEPSTAEPVEKVVDTTGAGDQYAAGFMFGLVAGPAAAAMRPAGHRWRRRR